MSGEAVVDPLNQPVVINYKTIEFDTKALESSRGLFIKTTSMNSNLTITFADNSGKLCKTILKISYQMSRRKKNR